MSIEKSSITIDMKKKRIRVLKKTLELLGHPNYVQLLVSPQQKLFVIRAFEGDNPDKMAERVNYQRLHEGCLELYSTMLIERFRDQFIGLDHKASYRFFGEIKVSERMALYHLDSYVRVESIGSEDGDV